MLFYIKIGMENKKKKGYGAMEETKICSICGKELPITTKYFERVNENKDGFANKCKECRSKERYEYIKQSTECIENLTKTCSKCGKELPATTEYFEKQMSGKYGVRSYCKECRKKYMKQYNEKIKSNPIKSEEVLLEVKVCTKCNKKLPNNKDYFIKDSKGEKDSEGKFKLGSYCRECAKRKFDVEKYKERIKCKHQKRIAKKKNLTATLTPKQWKHIKSKFNNKCCYCGKELTLTQEHFIALNNGGEYTHNNIIPACMHCNSSKQDKDFFEWYPKQEFYSKKREKKILDYLNYDKENKTQQLALDSAFLLLFKGGY